MNRSNNKTPPVSEGQEIDVRIESIGEKGDGVARVQGFVVFVSGVKKGDWVSAKVKKVLASVVFAEKIKDIEPPAQQHSQAPRDEFSALDLEGLGEGSEDFGEEE